MQLIKPFARDERGSATIELALVLPILALVITGATDLATAYSRKLHIEQAAQRAIERVMQTTTTTSVHEALAAEAAKAAGVPEDQVTVTYLIECDGKETNITSAVNAIQVELDAGTPLDNIDTTPTECAEGTTNQRAYLTLRITDLYEPVVDPRIIGIPSQGGKFPISVESGIRTR